MKTFDVPDAIPLTKVRAFLTDLGIDAKDCRELNVGMNGVHVELAARDDAGKLYVGPNGDLAVHRISIRMDWDA